MRPDEPWLRSRLLILLALAGLVLATLWAVRTPPAPNSDRYDYVGRSYHAVRGEGLRAHVVYPLRMALPDASTWPPTNLSRPPLWPALLVPAVRVGAADGAGVLMAALITAGLALFMRLVGDRTFGRGAGGMAALALIASFATVRALWGGGPELAMALITFVLWTWSPALHGVPGYLACGTLYGLLPLLHPTGWLFAALALVARSHRYAARGLPWLVGAALMVGLPWYLHWASVTGEPGGFVQGQAELARSVQGGMGPYRTLEPAPTAEVLREEWAAVARLTMHRLRHHALHLDGWLAWPSVLLALVGARRDPQLALRDAALLAVGFAVLSVWSPEPRLLVPLLPVATMWSGAGFAWLSEVRPRLPWLVTAAALVALPWLLPLGWSQRPPRELASLDPSLVDPPARVVDRVARAGNPRHPIVTDSAVLAWRAKRTAVLLPDRPRTLERLRSRPVLAGLQVLVLANGTRSLWTADYRAEWDSLFARCRLLGGSEAKYFTVELPPPRAPEIPAGSRPQNPRPIDSHAPDPRPIDSHAPGPGALDSRAPDSGAPNAQEDLGGGVDTRPVGPGHELPPEAVPEPLVEIPPSYASREGLRLLPRARRALMELLDAAREDGVPMRAISAYRSYEYQRRLHESAVARHGADQQWVARPGQSEHQLGTAVDVADEGLQHVLTQEFGDTQEGKWLAENAPRFGFDITYTEANARESGILPEPWHIRFVGRAFDDRP